MDTKQLSEAISHLIPEMIRGAQMDFFIKSRITQTQMMVLATILAKGRCPMHQLATEMKVTRATISGIVSRLVRLGYVERQSNPKDRREIWVGVTGAGEKFMGEFRGVIRERWSKVIAGLSPEEKKSFFTIVEKLRVAVGKT